MERGASLVAMVVGGVVLGLLVLLYGEATGGTEAFVIGGGLVVLASVGVLTVHVARTGDLSEGEAAESH